MISHRISHSLQDLANSTLLTSNQRLSRTLQKAYDQQHIDQGHTVWPTLDILPYNSWLIRCWESRWLSVLEQPSTERVPILLTATQELILWEQIVAQSAQANGLLQVTTTARQARDAWYLQQVWQLSPAAIKQYTNEDIDAYLAWSDQYQQQCQKNNWMDNARLPQRLTDDCAENRLTLPTKIILAGFDELTPQQITLNDAIKQCGTDIEIDFQNEEVSTDTPASIVYTEACDHQHEIKSAAIWARSLLEADTKTSASQTNKAPLNIAIVIPDLNHRRQTVEYLFDQVLQPQALLTEKTKTLRPYNLSVGLPLTQYPVIHTVFQLLNLSQREWAINDISSLLRSPFISGAITEGSKRSLLDAHLHRDNELVITLKTVLYQATPPAESTAHPHSCEQLATLLRSLQQFLIQLPRFQSASQWASHFSQLFILLGWPGERALSSHEYQTVQAWQKCLETFAHLDAVKKSFSINEAITTLKRLATNSPFQPQSHNEPIQVMGILETAGMKFDHLWVMGLHDESWPGSPRPNPFLPRRLQRDLNLPRSSAARELQVARTMTTRLLHCAPDIIFSSPAQEGERELRPSPLLSEFTEIDIKDLITHSVPGYAQIIKASQQLESFIDRTAPPIQHLSIRGGGSALFKDQAACPFRAFATHRLNARPLEVPEIGLSASERGNLVHEALELIWQSLKNHQTLCQQSTQSLNTVVSNAIKTVIDKSSRFHQQTYTQRFTALEQRRLEKLINQWLLLEKDRPPFSVIATEKKQLITVSGLEINTKIDRIDQLADNKLLIIDYKTGKPKASQWNGERLDEPQLPLYAMTMDQQLAGISFAQVRLGEHKLIGTAKQDGIAVGINPFNDRDRNPECASWEAQLKLWESTLTHLANAFKQGNAIVDPKSISDSCAYCSLSPLCRINEIELAANSSETATDNIDI